jgi:hypothetical protein
MATPAVHAGGRNDCAFQQSVKEREPMFELIFAVLVLIDVGALGYGVGRSSNES